MSKHIIESTYTGYEDAGHGWLAVPRSTLSELGILQDISQFSYMRGGTVYLEEDLDLTTFVNAFKTKYGVEPLMKWKYVDVRSPIRSYAHFTLGE